MTELLGIDLAIWIGLAALSFVSLMIIWKIAGWKGRFDQWKREVDEWQNRASSDGFVMESGMEDGIGMRIDDSSDRSFFENHTDWGDYGNRERHESHESYENKESHVAEGTDAAGAPDPRTEVALLYALTDREDVACTVAGIENDKATIHHDLGNLLYRSNQLDEAEKEYRAAIRHNPDFAKVHANLGFLLKKVGRDSEAIQEFRTALDSKDQLPDSGERITQILKEELAKN